MKPYVVNVLDACLQVEKTMHGDYKKIWARPTGSGAVCLGSYFFKKDTNGNVYRIYEAVSNYHNIWYFWIE